MKKIILFIVIVSVLSCNSNDCFDEGAIEYKEIDLPFFNKITVGNEVSLIIKQGTTQQIIIETGKNLWEDISYKVEGNRLLISDHNTCNLSRNYAVTKVFITTPNIIEIRSNTARTISSEGILNFNALTIFSENFHEDTITNANFDLHLNSNQLKIVSNGSSIFNFKGFVDTLSITFASGSSRFNGNDLIASDIIISQKSTNDMLIHPTNSVNGHIFSIGNVVCYDNPQTLNITEHYTGKLLFN